MHVTKDMMSCQADLAQRSYLSYNVLASKEVGVTLHAPTSSACRAAQQDAAATSHRQRTARGNAAHLMMAIICFRPRALLVTVVHERLPYSGPHQTMPNKCKACLRGRLHACASTKHVTGIGYSCTQRSTIALQPKHQAARDYASGSRPRGTTRTCSPPLGDIVMVFRSCSGSCAVSRLPSERLSMP